MSEEFKTDEKNDDARQEAKTPFFLEAMFTISQILIIATGGITAVVSLMHGVSYLQVVFRASLAVLVMGLLMWVVNWYSIRATLSSVQQNITKTVQHESESEQKLSAEGLKSN